MDIHYIKPDSDQNESRLELLNSKVQDLDVDGLLTYITQLEEKYRINCRGDPWVPLTAPFKMFYNESELDQSGMPLDLNLERNAEQNKRTIRVLGELYHKATALDVAQTETEDINGDTFKVCKRISRLIDEAEDCFNYMRMYSKSYDRRNHPMSYDVDHASNSINSDDASELSSYQQLILEILKETSTQKIRKYKGQCCKQIISPEGHNTKAWKPIMTIAEFLYTTAQKEPRFDLWKHLTYKGSCAKDVVKHLTDCKDIQFPEIKKNRCVWSFTNGIFIGKEWNTETGEYNCKFYPYESKVYQCLDPMIVSSKYFDKTFRPYEEIDNWWEIPTPYFQSVLDYQQFEEDVCRWIYVMGGKMCFDVGDIDRWQIIPFLKGIARSGKSTIITKVFKKFYDSEDVRTLSNNIEKKFGLSSIYDGFMFIAPEIKGDLCLEQAEFQSLVSGEDVSVARKNEKAASIEWKTPGILGGNEVPNWKDNSGSVLRRILPWNFSKQVMNADPHLDDKLEIELPVILMKCVKAYLEYAQKYADQDIWNIVPKYFKSIQTQVAMITNSLQNFLASEKVKYGENLFVPQKIFVQIFNQHCQENNLGKFKFNTDFYAGPFSTRNVEVRTEARTYKGRAYPPQPIVFGVDIIDDTIQMSEDY
jgi:hypothetical protein